MRDFGLLLRMLRVWFKAMSGRLVLKASGANNLEMIWFARPALSSRSAPMTCRGEHSRCPLEAARATELLRILADASVNLN